jgi:alpha-L-rhamnosidase
MSAITLTDLRCEYMTNPLGLGERTPRLSWRLLAPHRGAAQCAYQIRAAPSISELDKPAAQLWDSGRIDSGESLHHRYAGAALRSGQRCCWQVRIWDEHGAVTAWSEPAWWEMGLLDAADWAAQWITPGWEEDPTISQPSPLLRRDFTLTAAVVARARLYITAQGLYVCEINGHRVGDALLTPGWTSYHHRLLVQSYDVTELLQDGANTLGAILGEGWYRGRIGAVGGLRCAYGETLGLLAQLVIHHADGTVTTVASDEHWQAATGPILSSGIYDGEHYDARCERRGWSLPGGGDHDWQSVRVLAQPLTHLESSPGPHVRIQEELPSVAATLRDACHALYDFGENIAGWTRIAVRGEAGVRVILRHAEALDADGALYTANLRSAQQTEQYILRGDGVEVYAPHFTYHGFRYVEVETSAPLSAPLQITGIVVYSDLETTGNFACSDARLNQLQRNIVRSQRGNFIDIPTDCPQRDERLGWAGDAQVFAPTACFNMQCAPFFSKWLRDLAADQRPDGAYPVAAPMPSSAVKELSGGSMATLPIQVEPGYGVAGYSDAGVIVPWTLYLCYGDPAILTEHYTSMARWIENLALKAGDDLIWSSWFQFGDWLALNAPTLNDLVATAYFAHSTYLLAQIAHVLGKREDAERYRTRWEAIRRAFVARFVQPDGAIQPDTQSAYVLALAFDLLPETLRAQAAQRLVALIRARNNHLSTGFMGTPHLCEVLVRASYLDVAYDLLLQESYPSWLYPLTHGATTIWERWNGVQPDGVFFNPAMNSFNHYAYGAIGDWLYHRVGGIDCDVTAPGYQHVLVRPQPGGGITWARTTLHSPYGEIVVKWEIVNRAFTLDVIVPPNTTATVTLPTQGVTLESGQTLQSGAMGVLKIVRSDHVADITVGAGAYHFTAPYTPISSLPSPPPNCDYRAPRFSIHTSVSGIYADEAARAAVLTALPDTAPALAALLEQNRRRPYSLDQLAILAPAILTPENLAHIDQQLAAL